MTQATDAIKAKIKALLAKAEATEHEGEASVFMAKAVELMEKHQVELFELNVDDPIGMSQSDRYQQGPPSYKSEVHRHLALYYGAKGILVGNNKHWHLQIVGPESARVTTEVMIDFVWAQVCKEARAYAKEQPWMNTAQATREIAKALTVRISRELSARKTQADRPAGSSLSLAVVNQVDAWIARHMGDLQIGKARTIKTKQSAHDRAANIKLNQQFGNRDNLRLG